jgi:hypothetical protein
VGFEAALHVGTDTGVQASVVTADEIQIPHQSLPFDLAGR